MLGDEIASRRHAEQYRAKDRALRHAWQTYNILWSFSADGKELATLSNERP